MLSQQEIKLFRQDLLRWYEASKRDLPWRRTRDPYAIWLSEVMLQQTRVAAVIPYYHRFLDRFPNVHSLAQASQADLLSHWAGLGYYHRARNLQRAAQLIVAAGAFPPGYHDIRALPGIGDYTAAAVASIAFGLPHAVVDGNVLRVLSRVFNDSTNIASGPGRKRFAALADKMLDQSNPGAYNQALMELGAVICLPKTPRCLLCPVSAFCQARARGRTTELPVKVIAKNTIQEERTLFWIERNGQLLVWQREAHSRLMPGFWELPEPVHLPAALAGKPLGTFKHGITIYNYSFQIIEAAVTDDLGPCSWQGFPDLKHAPVSTILKKAMRIVDNQRSPLRVTKAGAGG